MKKSVVFLCAIALIFGMAGMAGAIPIDFDIAGEPDSSVTLSNVSTLGWTSIDADLVVGLDDEIFSLEDDESYMFSFFTLTVGGLGRGTADIEATLAFDLPSGFEVSGYGSGGWWTIFGILSGGCLTWTGVPQTLTLTNGDYFDVDFENVRVAGWGNSTTVSATVTAHAAPIPEPATMLLFGAGLVGLAGFGRKKFRKS
jgi:hypothetical protein